MDAMADAVDLAEVMLFGFSAKYKESANVSCRSVYFAHQIPEGSVAFALPTVPIRGTIRAPARCPHDSVEDDEGL